MLLKGGELDGVRLLSPRTVALMTADQLPPDVAYCPTELQIMEPILDAPTPIDGQGFGLGFAVRTQEGRNPREGSVGDYYWRGLWGAHFLVDPKEKLVAVLMIQVAPVQGSHCLSVIRNLAYQAHVN
jgi:CubicO group peptidase (beta-lactamase class C family)